MQSILPASTKLSTFVIVICTLCPITYLTILMLNAKANTVRWKRLPFTKSGVGGRKLWSWNWLKARRPLSRRRGKDIERCEN
jgi:hypothetical protein